MSTAGPPPPACPRPELHELLGSWELGLLDAEQAQRVEVHALECDACFEELYGGSLAAERLRSELPTAVGVQRVPRLGLEAPARRGPRRRLLIGSLAAAVLIVAALGVLTPWKTGDGESERTRGPGDAAAVTGLEPVGAVVRPARLDWTPVAGAREYRVRVSNSRGLIVWEAAVAAPPAALPDEAREALEVGATYYWQVEAVGAEGLAAKSPLTGFTVAR